MVIKRNLLCIKKKENLDLGHILLYEPYKNMLLNFVELAINPKAIEFDPVSRAFSGLEGISEDIKHYYESLLGVPSYFQASKGGRGRYIEKKISSIVETCSLDIKLSELPIWFLYPDLYRKRGIFTISGLSSEEKLKLRRIEWDWSGDVDETTDLGNLLDENTVVLLELKNRVDSGGTAARREIWTKKFKRILEILSTTNKMLYRKGRHQFSLIVTVINERTFLLKWGKNYVSIFKDIIKKDRNVRELFDDLIILEGSEDSLNNLVGRLLSNYWSEFPNFICPPQKEKEEYIGDIIQVLASSEA